MTWPHYQERVTVCDVLDNGACIDGVLQWVDEHKVIADIPSRYPEPEIVRAACADGNGNGYGDGNGSGDGYGDGSGYGYGDGSGYGSGDGSGYGSGYGDGYGYGYGSGSGYGYGDGDGGLKR